MPKREWGSPEHWVICPGCGVQMKWEITSGEDVRVIGFVTRHGCMDCGERAVVLMDNNRNTIAVYSEPQVESIVQWYDDWDEVGKWRP
jgi:hypothetical protein